MQTMRRRTKIERIKCAKKRSAATSRAGCNSRALQLPASDRACFKHQQSRTSSRATLLPRHDLRCSAPWLGFESPPFLLCSRAPSCHVPRCFHCTNLIHDAHHLLLERTEISLWIAQTRVTAIELASLPDLRLRFLNSDASADSPAIEAQRLRMSSSEVVSLHFGRELLVVSCFSAAGFQLSSSCADCPAQSSFRSIGISLQRILICIYCILSRTVAETIVRSLQRPAVRLAASCGDYFALSTSLMTMARVRLLHSFTTVRHPTAFSTRRKMVAACRAPSGSTWSRPCWTAYASASAAICTARTT